MSLMGAMGGLAGGKNHMWFRLFTAERWIEGRITTTHRRLVDALSNEQGDTTIIDHASSGAYQRSAADARSYEYAAVSTGAFHFAVPLDEGSYPKLPRDPLTWVRKRPERVLVVAGPYEITGYLYLAEGSDLRGALTLLRVPIVVLSKAVVRRSDDPAFDQEYSVVCVNRHQIQMMCPP